MASPTWFLVAITACSLHPFPITTTAENFVLRPSDRWRHCGYFDHVPWCRCTRHFANCSGMTSGLLRGIPFIPRLPDGIFSVDLSRQRISSVDKADYFFNISHVTVLNLNDNHINRLHPDSFKVFRRLKVLYFNGNFLNYTLPLLVPIVSVKTLEKLYLSTPYKSPHDTLGPLLRDLFKRFPMANLNTMSLDFNWLPELDMSVFEPLPNLRELSVNDADVIEMKPGHLSTLERLYANKNKIKNEMFFHCLGVYDNDTYVHYFPYYPSLSHLELDDNLIPYFLPDVDDLDCFPALVNLSVQNNIVESVPNNAFSITTYPKLKYINLRRALLESCVLDTGAFSRHTLEVIDLSHNSLDFASDNVHGDVFLGCSNLTYLNLEGNIMTFVPESKFHRLLAPLQNLQVLNLKKTGLQHISRLVFSSLRRATSLHLEGNRLTAIPDGAFDDMTHLASLRLDGNLITTVGEHTFSAALPGHLVSVNLSNNPFECTCSLLWFRHWLYTSPALFDYPHSSYKCSNIAGADVATFVMNEQQCLLSHEDYVVIVVCFTMLIVSLTLVTVVYRYRWHIRLLLFEAYHGERLAQWHYRRQEDFHYDLFVSYDSEDSAWVTDFMAPVLEQRMGLRLCLHQRDFIPGKNIVDNILNSLQVSKRVLAVFSPNFAESQWCHFELNLCLSHMVENDDVMVVVMLRKVPARDISGAMAAVMKTTTYIEWSNEPGAVNSFWRRMTLALRDVLPATRQ